MGAVAAGAVGAGIGVTGGVEVAVLAALVLIAAEERTGASVFGPVGSAAGLGAVILVFLRGANMVASTANGRKTLSRKGFFRGRDDSGCGSGVLAEGLPVEGVEGGDVPSLGAGLVVAGLAVEAGSTGATGAATSTALEAARALLGRTGGLSAGFVSVFVLPPLLVEGGVSLAVMGSGSGGGVAWGLAVGGTTIGTGSLRKTIGPVLFAVEPGCFDGAVVVVGGAVTAGIAGLAMTTGGIKTFDGIVVELNGGAFNRTGVFGFSGSLATTGASFSSLRCSAGRCGGGSSFSIAFTGLLSKSWGAT